MGGKEKTAKAKDGGAKSSSSAPTSSSVQKSTLMKFLPSVATLEIWATFIQYIAILLALPIGSPPERTWPEEWTQPLSWITYFLADIRTVLPGLPALDFRAHFLILVVFLPMIFTVLMLIFFKSVWVVFWYLGLLSSLAAITAGFVTMLLPGNGLARGTTADTFFFVGVAGIVVTMITFLVFKYLLTRRERQLISPDRPSAAKNITDEQLKDELLFDAHERLKGRRRRLAYIIVEIVTIVALLAIGIVAVVELAATDDSFGSELSILKAVGRGLGRIFVILGVILFLHLLVSFSRKGRIFLHEANAVFQANFVRFMLLALTIIYIPVTNTMLASVACVNVTCPYGQTFPDKDIRLDNSATEGFLETDTCVPCSYQDDGGGCNLGDVCPGVTELRLGVDPSLSCPRHIFFYYSPAAVVMFFAFSVGVPYVILNLVQYSTMSLSRLVVDGDTEEERYSVRIGVSDCVVRSLFSAYHQKWRHFKLILMAQRFVVVGLALFLISVPGTALACIFAVHLIFFLFSIFTRPYVHDAQDLLANSCNLCLVFDCIVGFFIHHDANLQPGIFVIVFIVNIALPLTGMAMGAFFERRREKAIRALKDKIRGSSRYRAAAQRLQARDAHKLQLATMRAREQARIVEQDRQASAMRHQRSGSFSSEPLPEIGASSSTLPVAAAAVHVDTKSEQLALNAHRVDRRLNEHALKTFSNYFLFLGVAAFVSLCIVLVGVVYASTISYFIPHTATVIDKDVDYMISHEFANYADWDEFTDNCCCTDGGAAGEYDKTEVWRCLNTYTKQKARAQTVSGDDVDAIGGGLVAHDGEKIRGFCAKSFNDGVCDEPFYEVLTNAEDELNYFRQDVCKPGNFSGPLPTDLEMRRLW